jgi:hypothetical protein
MLIPGMSVHSAPVIPSAEATGDDPTHVRLHLTVIAAYVCIAIAFAWPLPLHLATTLPGPVSQDTGVYVWNLWVFRHEIVAHHHLPFATLEIMSLAPPVPLALHNYTAVADLLAFPLIPLLGTVRTFNILIIGSGVLSAYAMFLFAHRITRDTGGAWLAGLLFGFSPFMSARTSEHFSLVQTAPLVLFALLFDRLRSAPTAFGAAATGATVALAYMCDPYYAVYCLLMAAVAVAYSATVVQPADPGRALSRASRAGIDLVIACLALLVVSVAITGGGRFRLLGSRISVTQLYTPVLFLTMAVAARVWASVRPRIRWTAPRALPPLRLIAVVGLACAAVLAPVLIPVAAPTGERQWISPKIFWRSSAPGLDVLTLLTPNPMHPWFGRFFQGWLASLPHTPIENVASIPWTVLATLAIATWCTRRFAPRYWIVFTAFFTCLALGPFVHIAGHNLYVPTPWAFLRYVPVIGAARMPPRMIAVVILGVAVLLAFATRDLRTRVRRPRLLVALISGLLLVEMLPSPRTTYSAEVPHVFDIVAADPRPLALLTLPFGLRDGMTSYGNASPTAQFFQTFHGKRLIGGYVSRLPSADVTEYTRRRITAALIDLSEGRELTPERRAEAIRRAHDRLGQLNIGYVMVNRTRASEQLIQFAREAFDLQVVVTEGERTLFRTPLANPSLTVASESGTTTFTP